MMGQTLHTQGGVIHFFPNPHARCHNGPVLQDHSCFLALIIVSTLVRSILLCSQHVMPLSVAAYNVSGARFNVLTNAYTHTTNWDAYAELEVATVLSCRIGVASWL